MTKNIEWLKEEIRNMPYTTLKRVGMEGFVAINKNGVFELINQLDEPEVLSQEWVDRHTDKFVGNDWFRFVNTKDLQNLLVPKQELPVIPKFIAEAIEEDKEAGCDVYDSIYLIIETNGGGVPSISDWVAKNIDKYVRAWLDGFTVEEEELKYYVKDEKGNTLLRKVIKGFGIDDRKDKIVSSTKAGEASDARLTEQEIKDYDPRYMAFAKPVEEVD